MPALNNTLLRLLSMLGMNQRFSRRMDTVALERRLCDEGFHMTRWPVQRDLHRLAHVHALMCDYHRPSVWSRSPDAALIHLPGMEPNTALTFTPVECFLAPVLHRRTFCQIRPYLTQVQKILNSRPLNALGGWPSKVRVIHRGETLRVTPR
jgi:hypothetical protein